MPNVHWRIEEGGFRKGHPIIEAGDSGNNLDMFNNLFVIEGCGAPSVCQHMVHAAQN